MAAKVDVVNINLERVSKLGIPLMMIALLSMLILPLPVFLLDLLFSFNISLALIITLVTVYSLKPLDFAIFPSVLLLATLMRLSLNIASTRIVLLEGHNGAASAGRVIQAFGEFVVGGNYAVGLVVFLILVIINFVVVTKGAGRVSEVSARFTLDAMPGKQMAIDADLNSGLITQEQAILRREEISQEADFYGAMDGASKFVRGDAIASILILFINILGGLAIGTLQRDLAISEAAKYYTLLTIGDGLVAAIPSLMLSTATALIVTRVSQSQDMSQQIVSQLFGNRKAVMVTAMIVGALGLIPGMPNFMFLFIAGMLGLLSWFIRSPEVQDGEESEQVKQDAAQKLAPKELSWDDLSVPDPVGLEVGYRLIPLVDKNQGGQLMSRIKGVRKKLSQELGFLIHPVHIRDNLDLRPNAYRITLRGIPVAEAEVFPDKELAINPGKVFGSLEGLETKDPSFGLDAVWVEVSQREHAQSLGFTVVDASTVVATQLSQTLQSHSHELLGHDEAQHLLKNLERISPKLVQDLIPKVITIGAVVKVLQNLLQEGVAIRDFRTIAEAIAEEAPSNKDPAHMTAIVRVALRRQIIQGVIGMDDEIPLMTLDQSLEHMLSVSSDSKVGSGMMIEPGLAEQMQVAVKQSAAEMELQGKAAILVVSPALRLWLSQLLRPSIPSLTVLAYNEIPDSKRVKVVANVGGDVVSASK